MEIKIKSLVRAGFPAALTVFLLAAVFAWAWVEPTQGPPDGNVPAPINVGSSSQTKEGPLILNAGGGSPTGLIVNQDAYFMDGAATRVFIEASTGNVGIGTTTPSEKLDVNGNIHAAGDICTDLAGGKCLSAATGGSSLWTDAGAYIYANNATSVIIADSGTPVSGAGTRMMWVPAKSAFRAGYVNGTQWDDANIGSYSTAMGFGTIASGPASTAMGGTTKASGDRSTAMGYDTTASGNYSTAMGSNTNASGLYSTAMGWHTTASGLSSTAMGNGTTASGGSSTAMGGQTTASGNYSTAMGGYTTASGLYSTAMGNRTTASGSYSTAIGREIEANGDYSVAIALNDQNGTVVSQDNTMAIMGGNVGIDTTTPSEKLDVNGNIHAAGDICTDLAGGKCLSAVAGGSSLWTDAGTYIHPNNTASVIIADSGTPISGAGTRMMWVPAKSAFRAGYVGGAQWDDANIGSYSTAMGRNTTASGSYSTAMGRNTTASGYSSTAMGYGTTASGAYATAMGIWTTASGAYSTAMGNQTTASGYYSTAMGGYTTASGSRSTAMGYFTTASGAYSTAMGRNTTASGWYSTAMGYYATTTDSGIYSTAMGYKTMASATSSTAIGNGTKASGIASTAMGHYTTASADYSTAMGAITTASGDYSTAMGIFTTASGPGSTAMGGITIASGFYSTAMGYSTEAFGNYSTAMGYDTTASGAWSTAIGGGIEASGDYSIAIALNDQSSTVVSQDNTMAIMGGNVGIGTTAPAAKLHVAGDAKIDGDLTVTGNKNAVVNTSQGQRKMSAVEAPTVNFVTAGSSQLVNDRVVVKIEPLFLETINTSVGYKVLLTPTDNCQLYVSDKSEDSFVVKLSNGKENCAFDWFLYGVRKGYENWYMEK